MSKYQNVKMSKPPGRRMVEDHYHLIFGLIWLFGKTQLRNVDLGSLGHSIQNLLQKIFFWNSPFPALDHFNGSTYNAEEKNVASRDHMASAVERMSK